MAPETANPLDALLARRSVPALQLSEPGPSEREIESALQLAQRAPDHGALRPWRWVLIRGAARSRLSELFVRRMLERDPPPPPHKLEKARTIPLIAPLVIAAGAHIVREHKVPEVEQLLAAGAAMMNLLNAFHLQGYGAILLTGPNTYDEQIASALGFAVDERLLGFIYVGSIGGQPITPRERPQRGGGVREWSP